MELRYGPGEAPRWVELQAEEVLDSVLQKIPGTENYWSEYYEG